MKTTVIERGRGDLMGMLRECWERREVLFFLAWRDVMVRYKQTLMGVSWALLVPFVTMVVFTLVFNRMAGIETGAVPYPIFAYSGLLPWLLFQSSLERSSASIVTEAHLLTKVYFPRLLVPLASVLSALVDFAVAMVILIGMMFYYDFFPTWRLLWLPAICLLATLSAFSIGVWLCGINARFRDVRFVIPFLIRLWLFLSPVAYPATKFLEQVPKTWHWLYNLNPMVGVINVFRWAILGQGKLNLATLQISVLATTVLLLGGIVFFRRLERSFADIL